MDGEIDVESTPGAGATFWFTVPLTIADVEEPDSAQPPPQEDSSDLEKSPSQLANLSILIVEDYPDNRDLLGMMLEDFGCRCDYAINGQEALEKLENQPYDIVLMDCQMPVLDGYEATHQLRQREGDQRHTIVIGITAHAMVEDREKCLQAGMDDYLKKPILADRLIETLIRWQNSIIS
jgi:two-component system CheB/CheR fusion protein